MARSAAASLSPVCLAALFCVFWAARVVEANNDGNVTGTPEADNNTAGTYGEFFDYDYFLENFGVGYDWSCRPTINKVLESVDEFSKTGTNAVTTLMTLIPTLLTIGNLYVPRSSEAFGTSFFVGLASAAFGLGLPVQSIGSIPHKQTIDLHRLPPEDYETIFMYGKAVRGAANRNPNWATFEAPLSELHGWFLGQYGSVVRGFVVNRPWQFRSLKSRVHRHIGRNHWWYLPGFTIGVTQLLLLWLLLGSTSTVTAAQPLWSCQSTTTEPESPEVATTMWWLLCSAVFAMAMRALQWELSNHELVRIHNLPGLSRFKDIVQDPNAVTTAKELPPLYPVFRPIKGLVQNVLLAAARLQYVVLNPVLALKGAQGRRKPLVVLVHLSMESRGPFKTVLTGFIQGATLLVLTCFFGVYWGGTFKDTLTLLIVLLVIVTGGRLLGLLYIRWSAHAYGFTLVECYDKQEIRGVMRLLASMPDVMVEINGAQYLWGTRVDGNQEFRRFLVEVERGAHDNEPPLSVGEQFSLDSSKLDTEGSENEIRRSGDGLTPISNSSTGASSADATSTGAAPVFAGETPPGGGLRPAPPARHNTEAAAPVHPVNQGAAHSGTWPLDHSRHERTGPGHDEEMQIRWT
ncbi:MAG: hypothetical protein M1832_002568 [Thelocarpon impressellum]|nr:MAG: hypothetical protein M1832_002568 [Thelocarpon impressellum]